MRIFPLIKEGSFQIEGAREKYMNTPIIEYRERSRDFPSLVELYQATGLGNNRTPDQVRTVFENSRHAVSAFYDGMLIGAGRSFGDEFDCAVICDIAVMPAFQGQGIGKQILKRLVEKVKHHQRIVLYAKPGTEEFYRKLGFRKMETAFMTSYLLNMDNARQIGFIE